MAANQQAQPKDKTKDRTPVTFIKPWHRYVRGDVAGFSEKDAEKLIHMKVAVAGTEMPKPTKDDGDEAKA
jgi:hypothetical protein